MVIKLENKNTLIDSVKKFKGKRILVLGDMIADVYLDGRISRISREAPVLVLEHIGDRVVAGGAANVVNNVATLGGSSIAAGIVGDDNAAMGLKQILDKNHADTSHLIIDKSRPTTSKTRVIAGGRETVSQQIVRVDRESHEPLEDSIKKHLLSGIMEALPSIDGLVLSDYGIAAVPDDISGAIISECKKLGVVTIVDSRYSVRRFNGIDYVKQNDSELAAAYETKFKSEDDLREAGQKLLHDLDAKGVLITRGEKGMTLFERDDVIRDIPVSDKSEVYDVSGAGDTCVATMILSLAAGISPAISAELSNLASGIAVRKQGTATVSTHELIATIEKFVK
ncbi:MAG: carbohydrate kinase [Schwartzia sp.]|nr:carbohydrate kinase [Schwartzia sp. (in: firmicutes)]